MKVIKQEKTNEELMECSDRIIDVITDLNVAEKYKVLNSLLTSLIELLKEKGMIISEEEDGM